TSRRAYTAHGDLRSGSEQRLGSAVRERAAYDLAAFPRHLLFAPTRPLMGRFCGVLFIELLDQALELVSGRTERRIQLIELGGQLLGLVGHLTRGSVNRLHLAWPLWIHVRGARLIVANLHVPCSSGIPVIQD